MPYVSSVRRLREVAAALHRPAALGAGVLLIGVPLAVYLVDARLGLAFTGFALLALATRGWVRRCGPPYRKDGREHSAAFYGYVGDLIGATENIRSSGAGVARVR